MHGFSSVARLRRHGVYGWKHYLHFGTSSHVAHVSPMRDTQPTLTAWNAIVNCLVRRCKQRLEELALSLVSLFLIQGLNICFHELGVLGVLIRRALLFVVFTRTPDFWKLPNDPEICSWSLYRIGQLSGYGIWLQVYGSFAPPSAWQPCYEHYTPPN